MATVKGPAKRGTTEEQHRSVLYRSVLHASLSRVLDLYHADFSCARSQDPVYTGRSPSCMKGQENESRMDEHCQRYCAKKSFPSLFLALTRTVQEEMIGNEFQCKLCAVS